MARSWHLDLKWVGAFGRVESPGDAPTRVLVAGCGDGTEAFSIQRQLPGAEIVAVDFSGRSIAVARRLQRGSLEMRRIAFVEADLSDRRLPASLGEFDLITCQGVLSYFTTPVPVLKNLRRCLRRGGILYAGVNGSSHVSTRLRPTLGEFGYNVRLYPGQRRAREILGLCDAVHAANGQPAVAHLGQSFLASDVFGELNRCLPLAGWISRARKAGLHFRGNRASPRLLRRVADNGSYPLLMPRSRAQVCAVLERLSPAPFHQLLFSRTPEPNPPWDDRGALLRGRISVTKLYEIGLPRAGRRTRDRLRKVLVKGSSRTADMEWSMPEWEIELLRGSDGARSIGALLRQCPLSVPFAELRRQLYLLYQLGVINILPVRAGR